MSHASQRAGEAIINVSPQVFSIWPTSFVGLHSLPFSMQKFVPCRNPTQKWLHAVYALSFPSLKLRQGLYNHSSLRSLCSLRWPQPPPSLSSPPGCKILSCVSAASSNYTDVNGLEMASSTLTSITFHRHFLCDLTDMTSPLHSCYVWRKICQIIIVYKGCVLATSPQDRPFFATSSDFLDDVAMFPPFFPEKSWACLQLHAEEVPLKIFCFPIAPLGLFFSCNWALGDKVFFPRRKQGIALVGKLVIVFLS